VKSVSLTGGGDEIKMTKTGNDNAAVLKTLNRILEAELAGVVRYMHYSLMIYGHNRIPIVAWLRAQATESMAHAQEAGEMITHFGGHPSLGIGPLLESHKHNVGDILKESLEHERGGLALYYELLKLTQGKSILLEEFARKMISTEETHVGDVEKMLRKPE
jgi:bacterioferritin